MTQQHPATVVGKFCLAAVLVVLAAQVLFASKRISECIDDLRPQAKPNQAVVIPAGQSALGGESR